MTQLGIFEAMSPSWWTRRMEVHSKPEMARKGKPMMD